MKILCDTKKTLLFFFPNNKERREGALRSFSRKLHDEFFCIGKENPNTELMQVIMAFREMIKNLFDHSRGGYLLVTKNKYIIKFILLDNSREKVDFTKPWVKKSKLSFNIGLSLIEACFKPINAKYVMVTELGGISYFGYIKVAYTIK